MKKFRLQISVLVFLLLCTSAFAQNKFHLNIKGVDKDSALIVSQAGIQIIFDNRAAAQLYLDNLQSSLQNRGFVTASIDSIQYGDNEARLVIFLGEQYRWAQVDARHVEPALLEGVGWREKVFTEKPIDFTQLRVFEERMLDQLENTGYPFARVYLDSLALNNDKVSALLKVNKGPLYKIDSIRVYGNAKISNSYLQRYLDIPNGSIYNRKKLGTINKKLNELTYVEQEQPFNMTLLGTGSVLNLYLRQKRSSQINALIGFLPNNDQLSSKKLLITGEANILLKNALNAGETIGLNWQQLQVKSPRLSLLYQHPYLFNSPVGLDFSFDMFRKDSSFLNVNFQLGAQYILSNSQAGKLFLQRSQTIVSEGGINTSLILLNRRLPDVADVSAWNLGLDYELNNTNYRFNPRKGNDIRIITSIGKKELKRNSQVIDLKDPNDPGFEFESLYDTVKLNTYQFRLRGMAARYFPLDAQRNTIKVALNGGLFKSGNIFRNELFQIGGFKLLRGFDEESQYVSQFLIGTVEYHYLVDQNSYFYVLFDAGWGKNISQSTKTDHSYLGTGLGLAFETKAGIFNLAWAVGKRNDTEFNLRQSKIHFGFVNFF